MVSSFKNLNNNYSYLIGLLRGLNRLIHVKCLVEGWVLCPINGNYNYQDLSDVVPTCLFLFPHVLAAPVSYFQILERAALFFIPTPLSGPNVEFTSSKIFLTSHVWFR